MQKIISGLVLAFMLISANHVHLTKYNAEIEDSDELVFQDTEETRPKIRQFLKANTNLRSVKDEFKVGDTLSKVLSKHNLDSKLIKDIISSSAAAVDLNRIKAGTPFQLAFSDRRELVEFNIRIGWDKRLIFRKDQKTNTWGSSVEQLKFETVKKLSEGIIEDTLWNVAVRNGIPPALIMDMSDLFGWQIDFATDFQSGDSFRMLYEIRSLQDGDTLPGAILAADVVNREKCYSVFRFTFPDGKSDFYDANGNSVRCMFLKSPLRYRYISSYFSYKRLHPILKVFRPHLGIDYAAPSGTPVSALGDGVVIFKGVKGGFGNYIELRHAQEYVTCYGHLSGFIPGLKQGVRVEQGQVIGYVGQTGTATGPHLDFRVMQNGKFMNPLSMKTASAGPIPDDLKQSFFAQRDELHKLITANKQ